MRTLYIKLDCTLISNRNVCYSMLQTSVIHSRLKRLNGLWDYSNAMYHTYGKVLVVWESHSCHYTSCAVSAIFRQEFQIVLNILFTTCQACHKNERGHFQNLLQHVLRSILYVIHQETVIKLNVCLSSTYNCTLFIWAAFPYVLHVTHLSLSLI
jgi:hypothetical protein